MEAKELRLGNYVSRNGIICTVEIINGEADEVYILGEDFYFSFLVKHINPIPLNEDWLIKCGFPKHRNTMDLLWNYTVCLERQHNELYVVHADNAYVYKIDYVHQLQNLYFTLKGEELNIQE